MMKAFLLVLAFIAVVHAKIPNDGSRTGTCTSPSSTELAAPSFQKSGSSLTSTNLILNFPADEHFASVQFEFVSGSDGSLSTGRYCDFAAVGTTQTGTYWSQNEVGTQECDGVVFVANFNSPRTALGRCFNYDNTTDPNYTYYTAIIKVTTTQNRPAIRGIAITRTTTTALQLRFRFQRFITVSSTNATVVGSANIKSDIILQEFDTTTLYTRVLLYTSVQQPYNLSLVGADNGTPVGAGYEVVPQNGQTFVQIFGNNNAYNNGAGANDGTCDAAGVNNNGQPAPPLGPNGWAQPNACVQVWQVYIKASDPATCLLSTTVTFNFKVYTTPDYLGGSGLSPNTNFYQTSYTLASNDYCVKIVDEISLSGTLIPYGTPQSTFPTTDTPLYNYLFGQTVYFIAHVTPSAGPSITGVNFATGNVVSVSTQNNYQVAFDQIGSPLPANNVYGFAVSSYAPTYPEYAGFQFLVNERTVLLDNFDLAQTVSVTATFRVEYQNLGASSQEIELTSAPKMRLSATGKQALDLKTDVSITRPSATASSSSSLVAMVAGIAAGCVALTAFVALFLYRRATNKFVEQASAPVDPKELEALEKRLESTAV